MRFDLGVSRIGASRASRVSSGCFVLRSEKKEVRKQLVSADQQAASGQSPAEMRNSDVLSDQMSNQIDSFVDLVQMHLCLGRAFNSIKEAVPHVSVKSNEIQQETD